MVWTSSFFGVGAEASRFLIGCILRAPTPVGFFGRGGGTKLDKSVPQNMVSMNQTPNSKNIPHSNQKNPALNNRPKTQNPKPQRPT